MRSIPFPSLSDIDHDHVGLGDFHEPQGLDDVRRLAAYDQVGLAGNAGDQSLTHGRMVVDDQNRGGRTVSRVRALADYLNHARALS
jgi:hypothetical protein